jgi:hypothetical protein
VRTKTRVVYSSLKVEKAVDKVLTPTIFRLKRWVSILFVPPKAMGVYSFAGTALLPEMGVLSGCKRSGTEDRSPY